MTSRLLEIQELPYALKCIGLQVASWLEWSRKERAAEGLTTDDGTAIMAIPCGVWPDHGQLQNWVNALNDSAARIEALEAALTNIAAQKT